jgi:fatty acid desaturase
MNVELLRERATVPAEEARQGRVSDWLFVGFIMLLLAGLAIGSAGLGLYLLMLAAGQFSRMF